MMSGSPSQPQDQDEGGNRLWLQRLLLLLLILLGSFGCMFLAAELALMQLDPRPLRDVRSAVKADYRAGERRAAPLVPQVIEAVKKEIEATRPPLPLQAATVVPLIAIPTAAPTIIAQATPWPTATPTPRPGPIGTVAPTAARLTPTKPTDVPATVIATATAVVRPTSTAVPQASATATATRVPPTETLTPTVTALPPTVTSTPTATWPPPTEPPSPTATGLPAVETPTPTDTQPLPTDTPTLSPPLPTRTFTPPAPTDTIAPSETPTDTPVSPPVVLSVAPNEMVQGASGDPDIDVTVGGENFAGPQARLGQSIWLNVVGFTDTLINATVSADVSAGIYALTVENADGQQGVLPRAFTVHPRWNPTNTLESEVAFVGTFGPAAPATEGDDDHIQIVFIEVPEGPDDLLYVRMFDADTGGMYDKPGLDGTFGDTTMTIALRGGSSAYTEPDARSVHPGPVGIDSGTLITELVIGEDALLDGTWLSWTVNRSQGEPVGGRRVFKLTVRGTSGDDGNFYQVAISTAADSSLPVPGGRVFAYSWCVSLPSPGDSVGAFPYLPADAGRVTQFNFDFDVSPGSAIALTTPLRNLPVVELSGNGGVAAQEFVTFSGERDTTWRAQYVTGSVPPTINAFTFWFLDDGATALAIFSSPSLVSPP